MHKYPKLQCYINQLLVQKLILQNLFVEQLCSLVFTQRMKDFGILHIFMFLPLFSVDSELLLLKKKN